MISNWRPLIALCSAIAVLHLVSCRQSRTENDTTVAESSKEQTATDSTDHGNALSAKPASPFRFEEITGQAGIRFIPRNGAEAGQYTMLETLGTGVAIFDADRDGLMDIFFVGGGLIQQQELTQQPPGLFRNLDQMRFENVTRSAIIDQQGVYSQGVLAGDFDNDGFEDLTITGYRGIQFLRNQGDGSFLESPLPGINEKQWSTGGVWADVNGDGNPDLFLAHYIDWTWANNRVCSAKGVRNVCPPRTFNGLDDSLYLSNADGTFRDATIECGLAGKGKGLGVLACDPDQDFDIDLYVGNDTDANFYYRNDGTGKLSELAAEVGLAYGDDGTPNGSMGLGLCDYNNDQRFDLWVTNFEQESFALYRNQNDFFQHSSFITGVSRLGGSLVGWGTGWCDFDLDGDEDVIVANGHIQYDKSGNAIPQLPVLMENRQSRMIPVEFTQPGYFSRVHPGRGLALGDLDNDGDPDVVVAHLNEEVALLRNDCEKAGKWLGAQLIGRQSCRIPVGATLILRTGKRSYLRQVTAGGSYLSASDGRVFWGIPEQEQVETLVVRWPVGTVQEVTDVTLNRFITVIEPPAAQTEQANVNQSGIPD